MRISTNAYKISVEKPERKRQQDMVWRIIFRWILKKRDVNMWSRLKLLGIGPSRGLLGTRKLNFGFQKMWGIS
jgi:hypothetical protein